MGRKEEGEIVPKRCPLPSMTIVFSNEVMVKNSQRRRKGSVDLEDLRKSGEVVTAISRNPI